MATLSLDELADLLHPFYPERDERLLGQLSIYLDLLVKWNARMNLTSVREPKEMVRLHLGESLFAARHLPSTANTLLDVGSGAGFPGLPIQLALPELRVTLAESQGKKASFLREVVRTLGLGTEVWADRVETMPASRVFDIVTMRAVDDPQKAHAAAWERLAVGGVLAHLTSASSENEIAVPGIEPACPVPTAPLVSKMFHVERNVAYPHYPCISPQLAHAIWTAAPRCTTLQAAWIVHFSAIVPRGTHALLHAKTFAPPTPSKTFDRLVKPNEQCRNESE